MIKIDIEKKLNIYSGINTLKISADFDSGSVTHISGPSGAGKTTLLKTIAGLVKPDKGKIIWNGIVWNDIDTNTFVPPQKRGVGFVFQDYALFPNMNVVEHLQYATIDTKWINALLTIGKLQDFSLHKPIHLSGGQQQRLAILRALAIKPQLLLMDEPFSALDKKTKQELISDLRSIFQTLKPTVLIVSHNDDELTELTQHRVEIINPPD